MATTNRHLFAKIKIGDGFSIIKNRHLFLKSRLGDGLLRREYFYDCLAESTFSIDICHKPEEPVCWLLVGWKQVVILPFGPVDGRILCGKRRDHNLRREIRHGGDVRRIAVHADVRRECRLLERH